ncbi:MAG TPA: GDSL-type esterase/lipase family protein [Verrucomicrobiae bacterium]|nr:GDSL-type esterase/lipase family protein [Verrucomicrobiae bacterium]
MKIRFAAAACLALLSFALRAEVALTNFSAAKPIQIMAVGDSITDDCEVSGAWRLYLEQLLESNSIPFTFVGRQKTPKNLFGPPFGKPNHEGYCGTVIAFPGVFAVHNYTTTNAYLERIVPDALTNAIPDIMLIVIGANDLGRGRDPYQVSETDMPALLDLIFTKAPNVNVILSKPSTLRNATTSTGFYGTYATNVPIYGAALQTMVRQRRAAGQNVFLADMFSAVDYSTMIMSDHLHPNTLGLQAMAREFQTRIQTILTGTNPITASLIQSGDLWFYSDTGADLGAAWTQPGYDDSAWKAGYGRLGYGEAIDATVINSNTTTYFRKPFVVPWNQVFTNLNFRLAQTGGAIVYLNGREIYRTNLPSGPVAYGDFATTNITAEPADIYYQTNILGTNLLVGTNILAVELHASSATNAAQGFDLELLGGAFILPPPTLTAAFTTGQIILTWPTNTGATFALYSTPTLQPGTWQPVAANPQTNAAQISISLTAGPGPAFFRLQRAP